VLLVEELISGDPDDWVAAPGTGPASAAGSTGRTGPVAVLDLTDDDGAVVPSRFGPGVAADLDDPAGFVGPSNPALPSAPPRIKFTTFVVTEADRLLGTAYLLTGDRGRAEELLRTALASAGVTWQRSRSEPADDVLRAMARRCVGPFWWWDRPGDAAPLTGEVGAGLAQLGGRYRVAIVLRYHQRLTEEQTAAALGAPVGNVRGWLSRALDQLGIDTRLDLRPEAGPGLSRGGLSTELAALAAERPEVASREPAPPEASQPEPSPLELAPLEPALSEPASSEPALFESASSEPALFESASSEPASFEPESFEPASLEAASIERVPSENAALAAASFDEALRLEARLADIRRRLPTLRRRYRRRRAAGGTAIAAASVAVIAGLLALAGPVPDPILNKDSTITLPPASLGPSAAELFDPRNQPRDPNRFSFQTQLEGDPLLASIVGDRGQTDVVLRFTPATTNLAFSDFCQTWDTVGPWMSATLNGHHLSLGQCSVDDRANSVAYSRDDYPKVVGAGWSPEGVRVGRESVLRLRLMTSTGAPLTDQGQGSRVRMGIAVYQLNAPRVVSSGVVIKRQAENNGVQYSLGGYRTATITPSRRELSLAVPAVSSPALVRLGLPTSNSMSMEPFRVMVDGTEAKEVSSGGPITFTLPDAGPHLLSIQARSDDTGVMLLTWYQSLNEPVR
jgi:hypothetical protein